MQSFTGLWILNNNECKNQTKLLSAMGRAAWQTKLVNKADETFRLLHFTKSRENGVSSQFFNKNVHIYLDNSVLSVISKILRIPFNEIVYECDMHANSKTVHHLDDAKQFGDCTSKTSWSNKDDKSMFTIRWYLNNGVLKVRHTIEQNKLVVILCFTDRNMVETKSRKVYNRQPFRPEDLEFIKTCPNREFMRQPEA